MGEREFAGGIFLGVTFHRVGKKDHDNRGLPGAPYPALHSDNIITFNNSEK